MMKRGKQLLSLVLAVCLLLGSTITIAANETEDNGEIKDSSISEVMNAHETNPLTGNETEPFNAAANSSILMTKENELLLYTSNSTENGTDFFNIFEKMGTETSYVASSGGALNLGLSFVTAVALNAAGNGTDDHIAYLGVKDAQMLQVILFDARNNTISATMDIGDVSSWIEDVDHWAYKTFFSITAGDYDNDGVDEIACTDHNMGVQMIEIQKNGGTALSLSKERRYDWSDLVQNPEDMKIASDKVYRRALISLATGNFDGTGAKELAVAVSTNHPGSSNLPTKVTAYTTHVAMVCAPLTTPSILSTPIYYTSKGTDEEEQDHTFYHILYAGQIAAGDLDGDRMDEVAVAGYPGAIELDDMGNFEDGRYELDDENIALSYVKLERNTIGYAEITVDEMTPFIKEGFFDGNELLVPLSIDAAKLHGQYGKESIFVGGKVYQFSDGQATELYTHQFFMEESSSGYTDAYVEHVISGVFGGPDAQNGNKPLINEQFVFTVVEKDNSQNQYNYKVGFISMHVDPETNATAFSDNTTQMNSDGYLLEERRGGALTSYGTALVPVAADIDEDGLLVKHVSTTYYYEDPSVEAVLQAAPYFDELGTWNEFNGTTSYSITVSRSLVDIWGYTHSIHFGFKGKWEGGVGELELKVGYALDMDFEHEKSYTSAYTTTFTAGPYDTVVVQRTPYICYEYAYVDIHGNLLTGEDAGSVVFMEAMHPVYFQLSVDEYNQFVDVYNAMADQHDRDGKEMGDNYRLVKITDDILPSNATGNPENYYASLHGGEYISQGTYALGSNGGFTASEFSYEVEETYAEVFAHGMHFELEGTAKTGPIFSAGGFVDTSFQETCGRGNATMNGNATGGEVANINPENYSTTERNTLNKYGFNWRCALWRKSLMANTDGTPYCDSDGNEIQVPVVGYIISNVKSPRAAPSGVEAYLSGNGYQVTVDWIASPDSAGELLGYYIYRSCDEQDPVQVNATILSATDTHFVDTATLKPGKIYTYYVVACYDTGSAKYLTMNSKSSSVVWGVPQTADSSGKYTGSMFSNSSFSIVMAMAAVGIAVTALSTTLTFQKKKPSAETEDEA